MAWSLGRLSKEHADGRTTSMTTTLPSTSADHMHAVLAPDARAARRARRMVYESCLITKVPSLVVNDAMAAAADLVIDMVAQAGGLVRIDVSFAEDDLTVRVSDAAGHENSAHVRTA
jgi:hypothetical protein